MNSSDKKNSTELISLENENINFTPEVIVSQITEYYEGRISKDIIDMVGHIINALNSSREESTQSEELLIRLEKYKYIVKIQQSLIQIAKHASKYNSYKR